MKAAVFAAPGRIVLDNKRAPEVGPGEALIRVAAGRIVGHEPVGVIDVLGPGVAGYALGQRVIVGAITPCGQCHPCLDGHTSQCGGKAMGGWRFGNTIDGAQAVPAGASRRGKPHPRVRRTHRRASIATTGS